MYIVCVDFPGQLEAARSAEEENKERLCSRKLGDRPTDWELSRYRMRSIVNELGGAEM